MPQTQSVTSTDRREIRAKGAARKAERNARIVAAGGARKKPMKELTW